MNVVTDDTKAVGGRVSGKVHNSVPKVEFTQTYPLEYMMKTRQRGREGFSYSSVSSIYSQDHTRPSLPL